MASVKSYLYHILNHPAVWRQQTSAEIWGRLCHLGRKVELGPHLTRCCPGRAYHRTKWHLGHNKRGPKIGGCAPFWRGEAGSPSSTMWPGPRPPYQWHLDPYSRLATIDIWAKNWRGGALPPFWGGGTGSASNTVLSGPRLSPYQVAS